MPVFNRKTLIAMITAATLAGCATTPSDDVETTDINTDDQSNSSSLATTYGTQDDSVTGSSQGVDNEASQPLDPALKQLTVYFDFDKANIRPDAYATLKAHAAYLSANPSARVRLEGHADERGTREYNLALGERRAKAAASYLAANGASRSQMQIISYGEERPAVDGHDEAAWAKNRRVEIEYTANQPK